MGGSATAARNQGNQADFILGTAEGWDAFGVVRWHGIEELSQPYRYEITLQRQVSDGAVDLDTLIDSAATFRIASQNTWRVVHGILAEAEEINRTTQLILYRVLLVPFFWRARYRRRCRNFLDKSLVDIVSAVLENRSPAHPEGMGGLVSATSPQAPEASPSFTSFSAPTGGYRWDVKDKTRSEDPTVRPYVVQYNESDFDFLARLLEDEGLTYYFEHGDDQVVLAITDMPGVSPLFDENATFTLRRLSTTGNSQNQEIVRSFRDTRRLRSRSVMVRDWDYNRSAAPLEATDDDTTSDPDLSRHFEFPVGEEAVKAQPGQHAATVRKQRYDAERALREGSSNLRTMATGYRFTLNDSDGISADANLLAVRVETFATELTPQSTVLDEEPFGFANAPGPLNAGLDSRFLALVVATPFRPAMRTRRPRIQGVQAAVVTAEEFPDGQRPIINGDELGRVRVRFPWDQHADLNDQTPTSTWLRVSQYWAGAGYGALYTPRVGHEVLVAYMQGDPDQPVIVGRVYNAQHTPPYDTRKDPTKSTVKSASAEVKKEVDGFNEIRFEDKAKKEQIFIHAQRSLDEVVLGSHSTSVGGDQSNFVGHDQTNKVKGHREHTIDDYETVTVGDDRTTLFKANEHHTVLGFRDTSIGISEKVDVGAFRDTHIGASEKLGVEAFRETNIGASEKLGVGAFRLTTIGANDDLHVGGTHNVLIGGDEKVGVGGNREVHVGGNYDLQTSGNYYSQAGGFHAFSSPAAFSIQVGGCKLAMFPGIIVLENGGGASVALIGGMIVVHAGAIVNVKSDGPLMLKAGGAMNLGADGDIDAKAPNIKLNG